MTDKLTACKECEWAIPPKYPPGSILARTVELIYAWPPSYLRARCKNCPITTFDAWTGEKITPDYGRCDMLNLDGHCPHFKEKET